MSPRLENAVRGKGFVEQVPVPPGDKTRLLRGSRLADIEAMSDLLAGTSSWTKPEWAARFYPRGAAARQPLPYYATRFRTVEIDATWHRCPPLSWVEGWREKTPEGFVFAAKIPKAITHEKRLRDCEDELRFFLTIMRGLGSRLGPILFQLPRFGSRELPDLDAFLARLEPCLSLLPADLRFAVEVRNPEWLRAPLFDLLHAHRVALVWCDDPKMPMPREWQALPGALTTDFLYIRLLGEHRAEGEPVAAPAEVDRHDDVQEWVKLVEAVSGRVERTYVYATQRFAGYAPGTAQLVQELWEQRRSLPSVESEALNR